MLKSCHLYSNRIMSPALLTDFFGGIRALLNSKWAGKRPLPTKYLCAATWPERQLSLTTVTGDGGDARLTVYMAFKQGSKTKSMYMLKKRIIMTDELIKKYKKKSEDYEKFQSQVRVLTKQLHSMHGSMLGLQKEMDCIFKEKEEVHTELQVSVRKLDDMKKDNERLRWGLVSEERTNHALMSEIKEAEFLQKENARLVKENKDLSEERDKWREKYRKLQKEKDFKKNRSLEFKDSAHFKARSVSLSDTDNSSVAPMIIDQQPDEFTNDMNSTSVIPTRHCLKLDELISDSDSSDMDTDVEVDFILSQYRPLPVLSPMPPSPVPTDIPTPVLSPFSYSCEEQLLSGTSTNKSQSFQAVSSVPPSPAPTDLSTPVLSLFGCSYEEQLLPSGLSTNHLSQSLQDVSSMPPSPVPTVADQPSSFSCNFQERLPSLLSSSSTLNQSRPLSSLPSAPPSATPTVTPDPPSPFSLEFTEQVQSQLSSNASTNQSQPFQGLSSMSSSPIPATSDPSHFSHGYNKELLPSQLPSSSAANQSRPLPPLSSMPPSPAPTDSTASGPSPYSQSYKEEEPSQLPSGANMNQSRPFQGLPSIPSSAIPTVADQPSSPLSRSFKEHLPTQLSSSSASKQSRTLPASSSMTPSPAPTDPTASGLSPFSQSYKERQPSQLPSGANVHQSRPFQGLSSIPSSAIPTVADQPSSPFSRSFKEHLPTQLSSSSASKQTRTLPASSSMTPSPAPTDPTASGLSPFNQSYKEQQPSQLPSGANMHQNRPFQGLSSIPSSAIPTVADQPSSPFSRSFKEHLLTQLSSSSASKQSRTLPALSSMPSSPAPSDCPSPFGQSYKEQRPSQLPSNSGTNQSQPFQSLPSIPSSSTPATCVPSHFSQGYNKEQLPSPSPSNSAADQCQPLPDMQPSSPESSSLQIVSIGQDSSSPRKECGYGIAAPSASQVLVPPSSASTESFAEPSKNLVTPSPELSLAQRGLGVAMKSPLPLPPWLVSSMCVVQDMLDHCVMQHWGKKAKKKCFKSSGVISRPVYRQRKESPHSYVFTNLQRLASNRAHLSAVIAMFVHQESVPTSEVVTGALMRFFREVYNPNIEHALGLFRSQCKRLMANPGNFMEMLDPAFVPALLRPECQIVALLAHMVRYSSAMGSLLHETSRALQQAIMQHGLNFHKLLAMSRVLAAILRLQGDSERMMVFMADLLKKPILPNEMYVLVSIGSVWPTPFCRHNCPLVLKQRSVNLRQLEACLLRTTLEVSVLHKYHAEGVKAGVHEAFSKNLQTYYGWDSTPQSDKLAEALFQLLLTSDNVGVDVSPMSHTPWQRPRPSVVGYQLVYCLNLLATCKRWAWTNEFLIGKLLWPILKGAGSRSVSADGEAVKEAAVVCVVRLVGFLCSFGLKEDPCSSSVDQLRNVLLSLLKEATSDGDHASLPLQLAAIDSLVEMSPRNHASHNMVVGTIKAWLRKQESHRWFYPLQMELQQWLDLIL